MHEIERHRIIVAEAEEKPVVKLSYLVNLLDASEATIRRDINELHEQGKLRKVRGGAEALNPPSHNSLAGRPYSVNQGLNTEAKRAIAREAVSLVEDGTSITISGGTTAFWMAEYLLERRLNVLTHSFVMAEQLINRSNCSVTLPGGNVYREQNIILSPFPGDVTSHYYAAKLFIGAQGVGPQGVMEADPQIVQAVMKLLDQAEQRILLVDSSKFHSRSNLIVCPLHDIDIVITDNGIEPGVRRLVEEAGCELRIAQIADDTQT